MKDGVGCTTFSTLIDFVFAITLSKPFSKWPLKVYFTYVSKICHQVISLRKNFFVISNSEILISAAYLSLNNKYNKNLPYYNLYVVLEKKESIIVC